MEYLEEIEESTSKLINLLNVLILDEDIAVDNLTSMP